LKAKIGRRCRSEESRGYERGISELQDERGVNQPRQPYLKKTSTCGTAGEEKTLKGGWGKGRGDKTPRMYGEKKKGGGKKCSEVPLSKNKGKASTLGRCKGRKGEIKSKGTKAAKKRPNFHLPREKEGIGAEGKPALRSFGLDEKEMEVKQKTRKEGVCGKTRRKR